MVFIDQGTEQIELTPQPGFSLSRSCYLYLISKCSNILLCKCSHYNLLILHFVCQCLVMQEQSEYLRTWKLMRFEDPKKVSGCSERPTNASAILGLEALINPGDPCASGSLGTTAALFHGPQLFEHFRHQRSHLPGEDKQYSSGLLEHGSDLAGNSPLRMLDLNQAILI